MTKIAFIGAGSFEFTRDLARDILTFPLLQDATFALMDIDAERLAFAQASVQRLVELSGYPAQVLTTTDRTEALRDADVVVVTVLAGGMDVWRHDIEIPKKYGVDVAVGDTRGPSGIFRALRTIPLMLDICRDMEQYCPDAYLLNYTNPMAMLCRAMQRGSSIRVTGLCHSVQHTARMLARWIGVPDEEFSYTCAGLNHMAWYTKLAWRGQDAYPLLRDAVMNKPGVYEKEIVRNEMFLNLGYYVTESSAHNSEYNWWFRKRPDLIEKYCQHEDSWSTGAYAALIKRYQKRESTWRGDTQKWVASLEKHSLKRGHEYAAHIINALQGGEPFEFNGNVPNTGLVTNLPPEVCVEVPVRVSQAGLTPTFRGALPPQCAVLTNLTAMVEEMAVEAALTGDPQLVYHAIAHDPLTAAVLSLAEIREMVREMFAFNAPHLPQFEDVRI